MKYRVLTYGNDILRKKSLPVDEVNDDIRELAADMLSTMYASNGIGLAAEQVGRTEAICTVHIPAEYYEQGSDEPKPQVKMPLVLINPEIVEEEGQATEKEGCLSFPDIFVPVTRPEIITVKYMDLTGSEKELKAEGLLARAIQHEMDHLNGVLLYDHMSAVQRIAFSGKLRRLKKLSD